MGCPASRAPSYAFLCDPCIERFLERDGAELTTGNPGLHGSELLLPVRGPRHLARDDSSIL